MGETWYASGDKPASKYKIWEETFSVGRLFSIIPLIQGFVHLPLEKQKPGIGQGNHLFPDGSFFLLKAAAIPGMRETRIIWINVTVTVRDLIPE